MSSVCIMAVSAIGSGTVAQAASASDALEATSKVLIRMFSPLVTLDSRAGEGGGTLGAH